MNNLARELDDSVVQEMGTVARKGRDGLRVNTASGDYLARRAVSCLVAPEVGDQVLVATSAGGRCYVLAVLERDGDAPTRLRVDGDLELDVPHGKFEVVAKEGVSLASSEEVRVTSKAVTVNALDGKVVLERLGFLARYVQSEVEKVRSVAGTVDTVLERFSQRVKRSYRMVEGTDVVRAESVDYVADKTMNLRSENTLMTAKELVKLDGEQIHVG